MFWRKFLTAGGLVEPRHIRRARSYLEEARLAMLEHSIAAEHYKSCADMYAERVIRLEEELRHWEEAQRQPRSTNEARPAERQLKSMNPEAAQPSNPTPAVVRAA
ncbi:hypothetical protein [Comamonas composti]|uniref:hypothetical protein n=1 Tax=Comamonas composti TaxID=408558 RepID=UPI000411325A|nr:hypothetical protein [Comamonas composti]